MAKKYNFKNINILLADSDNCLSQAVAHNLRAMGFTRIQHVRSAAEAITAIRTRPTSFLITEWDMKGTSGLELVKQLRRAKNSPNRTLPIIMLTGRGELSDVQTARDVGITEFVVKPFSAQTLFNRIEQLVEHPRSFVISPSFVGPERRRKGLPPPGTADRRTEKPIHAAHSKESLRTISDSKASIVFSPDLSLQNALGTNKPLASLITADILQEAQHAIDVLGEDSLTWIREDLAVIDQGIKMLSGEYSPHAFEMIKDAALSIKSRAGTFGYRMASDVARLLFLFLTVDFVPTHPRHLLVIQKHFEVLTVIFAHKIREREGVGVELYEELQRLIAANK